MLLAILVLPAAATADGSLWITPSSISIVEGTTVTFNAMADANATLTWSFDDGASTTGLSAAHTFTGVGRHMVNVAENDAGGAPLGTATVTVDVTAAPQTQWTSSPYPTALPTGVPPGFKFPMFAASARPRRMPASHAAILASCMVATGACHGTIVLRSAKPVRDRPGRRARVVELGRKAFTLAPDATATIAVSVPRRMRALVKRLRRIGATALVAVHDDAGNTANDTVAVTLTR